MTGNTEHYVVGTLVGKPAGVAIARYEDDSGGWYLFYCDGIWDVITDTFHESIEKAKAQAEFEFEGVSRTWVTLRR